MAVLTLRVRPIKIILNACFDAFHAEVHVVKATIRMSGNVLKDVRRNEFRAFSPN